MEEDGSAPPAPQKSQEQLMEEKKQKEEEERQQAEERKRQAEEARLKREEDMKKLEEALKGSLSTIGKTANGKTLTLVRLNLAEKELENLFPSILRYKEIRYLDLSSNAIQDPTIITQLEHLLQINLAKNQISSLKAFSPPDLLKYLQVLNLSTNKIKALTELGIPALRRLNLTENEITEIADSFEGHPSIEILELRKNKLKKLKNLKKLVQLKEVYICENQLTDIRGITRLPNLEKLSVRNNKLKGFMTPFPYLPALKHLNMRENQLTSLKELAKIDPPIFSINFLANPLAEELGENAKREVIFLYPHYLRINKSDVTVQDRAQFAKDLIDKLAQKERLEKEAEEAKKGEQPE